MDQQSKSEPNTDDIVGRQKRFVIDKLWVEGVTIFCGFMNLVSFLLFQRDFHNLAEHKNWYFTKIRTQVFLYTFFYYQTAVYSIVVNLVSLSGFILSGAWALQTLNYPSQWLGYMILYVSVIAYNFVYMACRLIMSRARTIVRDDEETSYVLVNWETISTGHWFFMTFSVMIAIALGYGTIFRLKMWPSQVFPNKNIVSVLRGILGFGAVCFSMNFQLMLVSGYPVTGVIASSAGLILMVGAGVYTRSMVHHHYSTTSSSSSSVQNANYDDPEPEPQGDEKERLIATVVQQEKDSTATTIDV